MSGECENTPTYVRGGEGVSTDSALGDYKRIERPKILYISNEVPDPDGSGSQRRAATHFLALERLGEVTLIVPPLDGKPMKLGNVQTVYEREPTMAEDRFWRHEGAQSSIKRAFHALRKLNFVDARARPADRIRFQAMLALRFDLVFAFRLRSVVWWESISGRAHPAHGARVVDFDDIESLVFQKKIESEHSCFWKWKFARELAWLQATEKRVARQSDALCLCSEIDINRMMALTGKTAWKIPNAVHFPAARGEPDSNSGAILFVGTLSYFPNEQGILWFVNNVWPMVQNAVGGQAHLHIVGLRPPPSLLALGDTPGITVTGNAPSVLPHYEQAQIVIAPLHAGSGTRIKLIEAASFGRAIVTTTLGCEGLGFVDGVHAEIADDPVEFAQRVVALSRDPERRARLANAARDYAQRHFSVEKVATDLEARLRTLIDCTKNVM